VVDDVGVGVIIAPSFEIRVAIRERSGHRVTINQIATGEHRACACPHLARSERSPAAPSKLCLGMAWLSPEDGSMGAALFQDEMCPCRNGRGPVSGRTGRELRPSRSGCQSPPSLIRPPLSSGLSTSFTM
jgi:hypothetical protein